MLYWILKIFVMSSAFLLLGIPKLVTMANIKIKKIENRKMAEKMREPESERK